MNVDTAVVPPPLAEAEGFCEGACELPVLGVRGGRPFARQDWVAEEVPVALEFNGISHAVMLATPLDLEDFALGFALSEGILDHGDELYAVDEEASGEGITLHLRIASAAFARLKARRRSLAGRTGCGLCGTESLSQVVRDVAPVNVAPRCEPGAIGRALAQLPALQTLQQATGAAHAAAWCTAQGEVRWLREDVGRHNALDKLIGAAARAGLDPAATLVLLTSRCSTEMVQKAVTAGYSAVVTISGPTSLAIELAEEAGLSLVAFARGSQFTVYTHPDRIEP